MIWKEQVTKQRGEYSARQKLAHLTKEKEFSSWATPNTMDYLPQKSPETIHRQATTVRKGRKRPSNLREQVDQVAVEIYMKQNWPTPSANEDAAGTVNGKMQLMLGNHPDVRSTGDGTLNPMWVEWLMGLPIGSTELGSWETE